ncbi:hypothetical protein J1614_004093 [Plenodomus biglobosus]|nr:hypothetical protein J1614_004093 [Plenodomus biglobosus]
MVDSIEDMPRNELCHTCHVRRLSVMQASQYSVYDENYKAQLEYVYAQCGLKGPTDIPKPLDEVQPVSPPYCLSNKRYTTKEGDTFEKSLGLGFGMVQRYNSWLDTACSNLQSATDFYGKVIYVSPQGGMFVNPTKPLVSNPTPVPVDGYTKAKICLTNGIDTLLFHEVNPSLAAGDACDASLKEQTALCTGSTYQWKDPTMPGNSTIDSDIAVET